MPYDAEHFAELERRAAKWREDRPAFMNDTKWREVFACLARHQTQFQVAWIGNSESATSALYSIRESLIEAHGLRDPGLGGPCAFRDIHWLQIPLAIRSAYWGHVPHRQSIEPLLADLAILGDLPIQRTAGALIIRGYA